MIQAWIQCTKLHELGLQKCERPFQVEINNSKVPQSGKLYRHQHQTIRREGWRRNFQQTWPITFVRWHTNWRQAQIEGWSGCLMYRIVWLGMKNIVHDNEQIWLVGRLWIPKMLNVNCKIYFNSNEILWYFSRLFFNVIFSNFIYLKVYNNSEDQYSSHQVHKIW